MAFLASIQEQRPNPHQTFARIPSRLPQLQKADSALFRHETRAGEARTGERHEWKSRMGERHKWKSTNEGTNKGRKQKQSMRKAKNDEHVIGKRAAMTEVAQKTCGEQFKPLSARRGRSSGRRLSTNYSRTSTNDEKWRDSSDSPREPSRVKQTGR